MAKNSGKLTATLSAPSMLDALARDEPGDRAEHGDAVVPRGLDRAPTLRAGGDPTHPEASCAFRCATPSGRSASFTLSMRSDSFTRSSSAPRDDALAARHPGGEREERQLVDQRRHLVRPDLRRGRARPAPPRGRRPARRPRTRRLKTAIRAPMRSSTARKPVRVGLMPTPCSRSSEPGEQRRRDDERRGRREVAGHRGRAGAAARRARRPPRAAFAARARPRLEHPLRVVARRRRLDDDRRPAVRVEPGEQDRRLHLGARHRSS